MTRKTGLIGLLVLCITVSVVLVAQAAEKKTLVGVWEVTVSAGGRAAPLVSIAIFSGDGSFTTTSNAKLALESTKQDRSDERVPRIRPLDANGRERV
jgi:hypothetical protein